MTVLELKGDILEKVSVLQDKTTVEELHQLISTFISLKLERTDFWDELSLAQRDHILKAMAAAKDKSKWIPQEVAFKKYEKWLS
ncbi:MAG: hypothetical protein ACKVUS_12305 [Saprospiraceae bacterium]